MALDDAPLITLPRRCSRCTGHFEEDVHTDGKIRAEDEADAALLDALADVLHERVPAGGAHDHVFTRAGATFDVSDHGFRRREIDDHIDPAHCVGFKRPAVLVLSVANDEHEVAAFAGDLSDKTAG